MAVFVISYDLAKREQHYADLYELIRALDDWCHPVDSSCMCNRSNLLSI